MINFNTFPKHLKCLFLFFVPTVCYLVKEKKKKKQLTEQRSYQKDMLNFKVQHQKIYFLINFLIFFLLVFVTYHAIEFAVADDVDVTFVRFKIKFDEGDLYKCSIICKF